MHRNFALPVCGNLPGILRAHGLRPTKQRLALAQIIFGRGHRHIAAEDVHKEAVHNGLNLSLATVYNNLHCFHEAGLLRIIIGEGSKRWFDTDLSDHHHFYLEETRQIIDVPAGENGAPIISNVPPPPSGMEIAQIDLMIKLRRKAAAPAPEAGNKQAGARRGGKISSV